MDLSYENKKPNSKEVLRNFSLRKSQMQNLKKQTKSFFREFVFRENPSSGFNHYT